MREGTRVPVSQGLARWSTEQQAAGAGAVIPVSQGLIRRSKAPARAGAFEDKQGKGAQSGAQGRDRGRAFQLSAARTVSASSQAQLSPPSRLRRQYASGKASGAAGLSAERPTTASPPSTQIQQGTSSCRGRAERSSRSGSQLWPPSRVRSSSRFPPMETEAKPTRSFKKRSCRASPSPSSIWPRGRQSAPPDVYKRQGGRAGRAHRRQGADRRRPDAADRAARPRHHRAQIGERAAGDRLSLIHI